MTTFALKEWDAQARALSTGQTAVILRKGGIMETHDGFEVEHREFLIYPTFLHQNGAELRPEFQSLLRDDPAPGHIVVPARVEVVAVHKVESLEQALALEDLQALNASAIERRFHYRNRPWLHAMVLRVAPLEPPLMLTETPQMLGCLSWVPLEGEPELYAGPPALSEAALQKIQAEIESRLS
jgi:hypothetical protein